MLTIPAAYTGTIRVWYQAPAYWRLLEAVSVVCLAGVIAYAVYTRRKRRAAATV